ncbi:MAG: MFS transporter [Caulobacter sp.]|nr:MFS transporter [Vitreoscilla sp.]
MTSLAIPSTSADSPAARLATRIAFLVAGFGVAAWAPLIPFAKQRLGADDGLMGLLLLCLGAGSVTAMLRTGPLCARYGCKPVVVASGLAMSLALPLLALAGSPWGLGAALFVFGGALGSLDVSMNVHAVEVERDAGAPLMSGFHAMFSVGGFAGAALVTFLLSYGLRPLACTFVCLAIMVAAMAVAAPRLAQTARVAAGQALAWPRGPVVLLAALAAVCFLVEGAMLDWGALLITGRGLAATAQGGLGYAFFAVAMTAGRLGGGAITGRFGDRATMSWGGVVSLLGFGVLLLGTRLEIALAGFVLIGLGASNIVPVLFRRAGNVPGTSAAMAVSALTTVGYAGQLLGPAAVGFVSHLASLPIAFWVLAALMALVPLSTGRVVAR